MEEFLKIAGQDKAIDYLELKNILDTSFKIEQDKGIPKQAPAETRQDGQQNQTQEPKNIVNVLVSLCCGILKKTVNEMEIFNELRGDHFSKDLCRSMVAMLDTDCSGNLDFEEFQKLWDCIVIWKKAFSLYDADHSGALSGFELRNALNSAGYRMTNHVLNILMHRYGNSKKEITFPDFIMCAVKLKAMIDKFQLKSKNDVLTLNKDQWIEMTLYS